MELIFIYNAKADSMNMLLDFAHKIVSPSTYSCDLCQLTHTNFGERKEWKDFLKNSSFRLKFYHIDEFEKAFNKKYAYPVVLKKMPDTFEIFLDSVEISKLESVKELIKRIEEHT